MISDDDEDYSDNEIVIAYMLIHLMIFTIIISHHCHQRHHHHQHRYHHNYPYNCLYQHSNGYLLLLDTRQEHNNRYKITSNQRYS